MFTDNTGKVISSAKKKIEEAESILGSGEKHKNIHWYASPKLSVMDKRGMIVPRLDFPEKLQLIARMDGEHWVTFQECLANQMSGREFKRRIAEYAHENGYTMIEVKEMFSDEGVIMESSIDVIE